MEGVNYFDKENNVENERSKNIFCLRVGVGTNCSKSTAIMIMI